VISSAVEQSTEADAAFANRISSHFRRLLSYPYGSMMTDSEDGNKIICIEFFN
jgi:hypothetical protein